MSLHKENRKTYQNNHFATLLADQEALAVVELSDNELAQVVGAGGMPPALGQGVQGYHSPAGPGGPGGPIGSGGPGGPGGPIGPGSFGVPGGPVGFGGPGGPIGPGGFSGCGCFDGSTPFFGTPFGLLSFLGL